MLQRAELHSCFSSSKWEELIFSSLSPAECNLKDTIMVLSNCYFWTFRCDVCVQRWKRKLEEMGNSDGCGNEVVFELKSGTAEAEIADVLTLENKIKTYLIYIKY